jgi:hypothetical protein
MASPLQGAERRNVGSGALPKGEPESIHLQRSVS